MIISSSLSRRMWKHTILLFLPDGYFVIESDFLPPALQLFCLFPPKRSRRWIFGKGEVNNGSTLIQRFLSVLVSGRLSLPLRTHDQFQHWTPRLNSAVWPVPYACAKPHHPGMEALISCLVPRRLSFDDPSLGPLWFITSHSFRARLCHAKNEAPEEEAALLGLISMA